MEGLEMENTGSVPEDFETDEDPAGGSDLSAVEPASGESPSGSGEPGDISSGDHPEEPGTDEDQTGSSGGSSDESDESAEEPVPDVREPGEGQEEIPAESPHETISGNDIVTISGNAVIFPEDFDLSLLGAGTESSAGDPDSIVQAVSSLSDIIYSGIFVIVFLLGVIAGLLLIHGLRLRRI